MSDKTTKVLYALVAALSLTAALLSGIVIGRHTKSAATGASPAPPMVNQPSLVVNRGSKATSASPFEMFLENRDYKWGNWFHNNMGYSSDTAISGEEDYDQLIASAAPALDELKCDYKKAGLRNYTKNCCDDNKIWCVSLKTASPKARMALVEKLPTFYHLTDYIRVYAERNRGKKKKALACEKYSGKFQTDIFHQRKYNNDVCLDTPNYLSKYGDEYGQCKSWYYSHYEKTCPGICTGCGIFQKKIGDAAYDNEVTITVIDHQILCGKYPDYTSPSKKIKTNVDSTVREFIYKVIDETEWYSEPGWNYRPLNNLKKMHLNTLHEKSHWTIPHDLKLSSIKEYDVVL